MKQLLYPAQEEGTVNMLDYSNNDSEPLVQIRGVGKKFCRSLMRSLWYGVEDSCLDLLGRSLAGRPLRECEFWANQNVSFDLRRGECIGLIGHNGAGKTTMLKMLNGLIKPDEGSIKIKGRVGALIALNVGFNPVLTGRENIFLYGSILGFSRREMNANFDEIVDFAGIEKFLDTPLQNYSSGMQVRLGFAVASQMQPDVLLIDEVLAVGDVAFRMKCLGRVHKAIDNGAAVVLVTHSMIDMARVAQRVIVLDHGRICFDGSLSEGTAIYQGLRLKSNSRPKGAKSEMKQRAYIRQVRLLDSNGGESSRALTGDNIRLEVEIEATEELRKMRLVVNLEGVEQRIYTFASAAKNFYFDLSVGRSKIEMDIPRVPLLVGQYSFGVVLNGPSKGEFIDSAESVCALSIVGPDLNSYGFGENGLIRIDHNWR